MLFMDIFENIILEMILLILYIMILICTIKIGSTIDVCNMTPTNSLYYI